MNTSYAINLPFDPFVQVRSLMFTQAELKQLNKALRTKFPHKVFRKSHKIHHNLQSSNNLGPHTQYPDQTRINDPENQKGIQKLSDHMSSTPIKHPLSSTPLIQPNSSTPMKNADISTPLKQGLLSTPFRQQLSTPIKESKSTPQKETMDANRKSNSKKSPRQKGQSQEPLLPETQKNSSYKESLTATKDFPEAEGDNPSKINCRPQPPQTRPIRKKTNRKHAKDRLTNGDWK